MMGWCNLTNSKNISEEYPDARGQPVKQEQDRYFVYRNSKDAGGGVNKGWKVKKVKRAEDKLE